MVAFVSNRLGYGSQESSAKVPLSYSLYVARPLEMLHKPFAFVVICNSCTRPEIETGQMPRVFSFVLSGGHASHHCNNCAANYPGLGISHCCQPRQSGSQTFLKGRPKGTREMRDISEKLTPNARQEVLYKLNFRMHFLCRTYWRPAFM